MIPFAPVTLLSPLDPRDIPYIPRKGLVLPRRFDRLPEVFEIDDQGQVGACVVNGFSEMCEERLKAAGRGVSLSRMFAYTATLNMEGRLGQEGVYVRDALKVLHRYGVCPEADYPYDLTKKAIDPPPEVYALAAKTRVERYEAVVAPSASFGLEIAYKVDLIKSALAEGLSIGFGMPVTESLRHLTGPWETQDYIPEDAAHPNIGGHFMVIQGWDDSVGRFLVQNSWGRKWGDGGFGGLPYAIVDHPLFEAWIVRSFDGCEVPEAPGIKLEWQQRFSIGARIVPEKRDIGKTVNVWAAAYRADGGWYGGWWLKTGTDDTWARFDGWTLPPFTTIMLDDDNDLKVVTFMDLTPITGADVYLAYGQTPLDWTCEKLCTVEIQK